MSLPKTPQDSLEALPTPAITVDRKLVIKKGKWWMEWRVNAVYPNGEVRNGIYEVQTGFEDVTFLPLDGGAAFSVLMKDVRDDHGRISLNISEPLMFTHENDFTRCLLKHLRPRNVVPLAAELEIIPDLVNGVLAEQAATVEQVCRMEDLISDEDLTEFVDRQLAEGRLGDTQQIDPGELAPSGPAASSRPSLLNETLLIGTEGGMTREELEQYLQQVQEIIDRQNGTEKK